MDGSRGWEREREIAGWSKGYPPRYPFLSIVHSSTSLSSSSPKAHPPSGCLGPFGLWLDLPHTLAFALWVAAWKNGTWYWILILPIVSMCSKFMPTHLVLWDPLILFGIYTFIHLSSSSSSLLLWLGGGGGRSAKRGGYLEPSLVNEHHLNDCVSWKLKSQRTRMDWEAHAGEHCDLGDTRIDEFVQLFEKF